MNILALDLGTTTGWACLSNGVIKSGTKEHKTDRFEGGGMRYVKFTDWLNETLMFPDMVVFEEVRRHLGVDAAHAYGGFLAHLTYWCEKHVPPIPYKGVPVGTIKKFWTGYGNASKEEMIFIARQLDYAPADDNEADALALLYWLMDERKLDGRKLGKVRKTILSIPRKTIRV